MKPYSVERVVGPDGDTVFQTGPTRLENVFNAQACRTVDALMQEVVARGTGKEAQVIEGARGKTGTTNDAKDAWFCGYAQNLIGIGWIANERIVKGRPKRLPMESGVFGGTVTVRMWTGVMGAAVKKYGTRTTPGAKPEIVDDTSEDVPAPRRRKRREPRADDESAPTITTDDQAPETTTTVDEDAANTPGRHPDTDPVPIEEATVRIPARRDAARGPEAARRQAARRQPAGRQARRRSPGPAPPGAETREPPEETVEVEVCADSGARATAYCPETVTRTFKRGKAPRGRCPIHRGNV